MRTAAWAAALVGSLLLGTAPVRAQDQAPQRPQTPADQRGVWVTGTCAAPDRVFVVGVGGYLLLGQGSVAVHDAGGEQTAAEGWFRANVKDEGETTYWQRRAEGGLAVFAAKGSVDEPPADPENPGPEWTAMEFVACEAVPEGVHPFLKEFLGLYQGLEKIGATCGANIQSCVQSAFDAVDATRDGRISRAEISRLLRVLRFLHMAGDGAQDPVDTARDAARDTGAMAGTLIGLYDYDADGTLTMREISRDMGVGGLAGIIGRFSAAEIGTAVAFVDVLTADGH